MSGFIPEDIYVQIKKAGWIVYVILAIIALAEPGTTGLMVLVAIFFIWMFKPKEVKLPWENDSSESDEYDFFDGYFRWTVRDNDQENSYEDYFQSGYERFRNSQHYKTWESQTQQGDTPYTILGVEQGASAQEIKKRYRELIKQYHPDLGSEADKNERSRKTVQIIDAYNKIINSMGQGTA